MKYSEYGWMSDNLGGWSIWEENDLLNESSDHDEYYARMVKQENAAKLLEEECLDVFFAHECFGNCKQCSIQEEYLNVLFCNDPSDCCEVCEDPNSDGDCRYCPIGLRKGIEQIGIRECQIKKKPKPIHKPSPETPMDTFKKSLENIHRI